MAVIRRRMALGICGSYRAGASDILHKRRLQLYRHGYDAFQLSGVYVGI